MTVDDRVQLRNPDPSKKMPRIAKDIYAIAPEAVHAIVPKQAPGITLNDYLAQMAGRLPKAPGWDSSLSANWLAMAIKLDLEARGKLKRVNTKPPQPIVRG